MKILWLYVQTHAFKKTTEYDSIRLDKKMISYNLIIGGYMLKIKNTINNLGVTILGDYDDFEQLYEALHNIVGEEDEYGNYESSRLRVLGLCYDIRHAMQGDREYELVDNGIDEDIMKTRSMIMPKNNVYLKINAFWPETLYILMVLNDFITMYVLGQAKDKFQPFIDRKNIWDKNISIIRNFQATVNECIKETIPETKHNRILNSMTNQYNNFRGYATQYLDLLNIKFEAMKPEKRRDNISIMAKRLVEEGEDYESLKSELIEASKNYNCSILELSINMDYPEEVTW